MTLLQGEAIEERIRGGGGGGGGGSAHPGCGPRAKVDFSADPRPLTARCEMHYKDLL